MSDAPSIYRLLVAVMKDVQAVRKDDHNDFNNYSFRGIDAVMNAVGPALREHEVVVVPKLLDVAYDDVTTTKNKESTACRVQMEYVFYAPDGSHLETSVAGEAWDSGDKACPKAMSVAFRTALLQALCLPTDEPDPDATTYERGERVPSVDGLRIRIGDIGESIHADLAEWLAERGAEKVADLDGDGRVALDVQLDAWEAAR